MPALVSKNVPREDEQFFMLARAQSATEKPKGLEAEFPSLEFSQK